MTMLRGTIRGGVALAALALAAGAPSPLAAQQLAGDCRLMDTFRTIESREVAPGVSIVWISRPDLRCPNGLRIRADSAVVYEAQGRNELLGNVRFTTAERDLTSREADWYEGEGRLFARGNVVFTDLDEGTEVRGDTLVYLEARGVRDEQVTVYGGRPSALLPVDDAGADAASEPWRVVAQRLRFQGEQFFWGDGNVEVEQGETRATSDSLAYDRDEGNLILNGNARVDRGEVTATGGTVNLGFADGRLSTVLARRGGRIVTEDVTLQGLQVRVELDANEEVSSVLAEGGTNPDTGTQEDATMEAENLFLRGGRQVEIRDAPDGNRILVASGGARAESLGGGFGSSAESDTGEPAPPAAAQDEAGDATSSGLLPGILDRDWIEGDDIEALFEPMDPAADDTPDADQERTFRLIRLTSTTNARALYRSPPDDDADAVASPDDPSAAPPAAQEPPASPVAPRDPDTWPISYILADLIVIHLESGEVRFLEAEGNVIGVQLEHDGEPTG
jgi:hypothetical protein